MTSRSAGIALDGTTLTIVWRRTLPHGAWASSSVDCDATPAGIAAAFAELGASVPRGVELSITLLRPLAHTRTVSFPPMARAALERVLERDWTRHVIGIRATPHTVTAQPADHGRWIAAFAPTDTLEALARMAAERDWRNVIVQTSDDALAAAAGTLRPGMRDNPDVCFIVANEHGPTDAVHAHRGVPRLGRRFLPGASADDAIAFAGVISSRRPIPVFLPGAGSHNSNLATAFEQHGHQVIGLDLGPASPSPVTIAVAGTIGTASLPLLSPSAQAARSQSMRRLTGYLALATAAALVLAFAIERWGVRSALASLQQQRANISASVNRAVNARAGLESSLDAATTLADREAATTHASSVISAIAVSLPPGSSLTTMTVSGDSVAIEGEGQRSAAVYDALRGIPLLEGVRLAAPLRQERRASDAIVEHFAFNARLRRAR